MPNRCPKMALISFHSQNMVGQDVLSNMVVVFMSHESRKRHLRRPHLSKGLTKFKPSSPIIKCPGLICLALPARQKFGLILVIKFCLVEVRKKSSWQKMNTISIILQWKKMQRDSDDFWHRKFTLKVQFSHLGPSWQS